MEGLSIKAHSMRCECRLDGNEHGHRCELWTRHVLEHLEAQLPRVAQSLQAQPRAKEV